MSTVYTLNGKVLKNSANDKWLTKKEAQPTPVEFVMDSSNRVPNIDRILWEGPNYPNGWDGNGKTIQIIVKETGCTVSSLTFKYLADTISTFGAQALTWYGELNDFDELTPGIYTATLSSNYMASSGFGKYIGIDQTIDSRNLSKLEFRIIDP